MPIRRYALKGGRLRLLLATGLLLTSSYHQAYAQAAPPTVRVIQPKIEAVTQSIEITGNAQASNEVKLIARVPGYLDRIHFEDGAMVKGGDLLFTIQQDQYKAQLQQAQAQLKVQMAASAYASTEVQRYKALVQKSAATEVELDHWIFEQRSAKANIEAAQAQVALAQLNLDYTEVRAPFDGQMGKHLVDPGNVVGGEGQQTALAEIIQLDPIYVVANIGAQTLTQIRANLKQRRLTLADLHKVPVDVALDGETGYPHHGTVEYVAPATDPTTGTLLVRGILANADRALLPGMFVRIRLPMGSGSHESLLVPDRALQADQGGSYLLVIGSGDVAQQRYVQLGQSVGELRVITSGIGRDDRVVIDELWRVSPGTKVVPQLRPTGN